MNHPYQLKRSARKTLAIEITRTGELLVRAPSRLPQAEIDRFLARKEEWIEVRLAQQQARLAAHPEPTPEKEALLRRIAEDFLPLRTAYYGQIMGLSPEGVRITGAKNRFGSCSAKNRICYSYRLMQYPTEAVDYVVVHELAHLVHKNHGPDFYRLVGSILPDYRAREALLKK
jgi:predicted metal-dependent hydrolase